MISTLLFTWLQGADFYFDLHKQAVDFLPAGHGETWLDIGSGPGLVTRLAAERGWRATGIDTDPQMVAAAKRIARWKHSPAEFQMGDFTTLPAESAQVVSAASLLAVLPDREAGLRSLWHLLLPGGFLLIVEPTQQMTRENACRAIQNGLPKNAPLVGACGQTPDREISLTQSFTKPSVQNQSGSRGCCKAWWARG